MRTGARGRRPARAARRGVARPPPPTSPTARAGVQLQRRLQGRDRRRDPRRAGSAPRSRSSTSPAPAPAAARASRWSASCSRSSAAARPRRPTYLCPCRRADARGAGRGRPRARARVGLRARAPRAAPAATAAPASPASPTSSREVSGNRHREERHARFINDRVHANIQNDGTFSRRPADPRRRHDRRTSCAGSPTSPTARGADGQDHRRPADRPARHQARSSSRRSGRSSACPPATPTRRRCARSRPASAPTSAASGSATRWASASSSSGAMEGLYTPHKVKSAVTGCPRNCAEAYVKDIGLVAVEGGWEIYVGGAAGATVRKGDLLATVDDQRRGDPARARLPAALPRARRSTSSAPTPTSSASGIEAVREAVLDARRRRAARALPDRQGGRRSRPVARAPRPRSTRSSSRSSTPSPR